MQPWLPVDTVMINGRKGTPYFISGARHNPGAMPLAISSDPSLALLAAGHRRLAAMQQSSFPGANSPERVSFREVIKKGAPIDRLVSQLVSISTAAIPSTRFRVTAAPVAAALVHEHQAAVRAVMNPEASGHVRATWPGAGAISPDIWFDTAVNSPANSATNLRIVGQPKISAVRYYLGIAQNCAVSG